MSAEKKYTEEDIEKMKHTVDIVFRAELAISNEWKPKLKDMLSLPEDERNKLADDYMRAIAIEILEHLVLF